MLSLRKEPIYSTLRIDSMGKLKLWILAVCVATGLAASAGGQSSSIEEKTRRFLDAYASGDRQKVLSLIDRTNIVMYGSDLAEVVRGSDAVLKLLDEDQRLWGGTARMGEMEHVSTIESKGLASIVFNVSFSVGGRPPIPVRVVAVWKRVGKEWLLVQSSNSVVTEHQSAEELLRHP